MVVLDGSASLAQVFAGIAQVAQMVSFASSVFDNPGDVGEPLYKYVHVH